MGVRATSEIVTTLITHVFVGIDLDKYDVRQRDHGFKRAFDAANG